MGIKILLSYPYWYILLCLIAGLGYSAVLYYRNRRDGFSRPVRWLMASLRFLAVFFLAALLLGPLVERFLRLVEEPLLIFAQDNSQSIINAADRTFDSGAYLQGKDNFLDAAANKFDVRHYSFGESFRRAQHTGFDDRITDISEVFHGIEASYSNRNIGAVILASDGIFNRGINPLNLAGGLPYPVYAIALGDTIPRKDLVVSRIRHNRITYLGNIFPVEVYVEARQAAGLSSRLSIIKDGATIDSRVITFSSDHHQQTVLFEVEAITPGMQRYLVEISPFDDEISLENNRQSFYIDVIDGRQKVLILANSPHPDIGALKMALEARDNYEVTSSLAGDFGGRADAYNLVVMHQLPARNNNVGSLLEQLDLADIPVLFIIGRQTDLGAFNALPAGLNIVPRANDFVEVLPSYNPSFALFTLADHDIGSFTAMPPLFAPFAQYVASGGLTLMMVQRIGQVVTEQPLIAFSQSAGRKFGIISGEGIWRWRLHTYMRTGHHHAFDEMVSRMVQYLSVQDDKSLFRVRTAPIVYETDPVVFDAELYNRSYELVNDPEVSVVITNQEGISFPYVMARTANAYQLDAGSFMPGEYSYLATVTFGAEQFSADGLFSVSELNFEKFGTIADHNLLFQLAGSTGGELFFPGEWDQLLDRLLNRADARPVMYARRTLDEMINMKAVFFLLLFLLSFEWFARKRSGSY